jgi:hypothetical protein
MAEGSRVRHVTVEGFEYEGDGDDDDEVLVFAVCPTRSRRGRCSRCDRKCRGYNQGGGRRRWRSLDLGTTRRLVISQVMLSFPFALIPLSGRRPEAAVVGEPDPNGLGHVGRRGTTGRPTTENFGAPT